MNLIFCREHEHNVPLVNHKNEKTIHFQEKKENLACVTVSQGKASTNYYIGTDWLSENCAILVRPKIDTQEKRIDYISMLLSCMEHPEVIPYISELYEIKFDENPIKLEQIKDDFLSPLLVIHFLKIVQSIVKKGLKKSYYKVEHNLHAKTKGKLLTSKTIKANIFKCQPLKNFCSYNEFGLNCIENKILKKALGFCQHYLNSLSPVPHNKFDLSQIFSYCQAAFENVSDDININELKTIKHNAFYKEYADGVHVAQIILKRYGYNIKNTIISEKIQTPPFWIDMSKLFELYVLGQLKDNFKNDLLFQEKGYRVYTDFLLCGQKKIIIDTKYKTIYTENDLKIEDIRQLSGYARDKIILKKLNIDMESPIIIDCLIIYPDQLNGKTTIPKDIESLLKNKIEQFLNFYKLPIKLPTIKE